VIRSHLPALAPNRDLIAEHRRSAGVLRRTQIEHHAGIIRVQAPDDRPPGRQACARQPPSCV
jgi:hypothetical protein